MKKILISFLVSILFTTILFLIFRKKPQNYIETYGNIEIRTVDLSFQVSGIIKKIFVEEGDYIKKGDLLAVIDDRDYKINYQKAMNEEKSQLAQKNEDLSKYQRNYPLCFDNTISKQECETLLNKKNFSEAKYKESVANKEFQKLQLDYTKMYAMQDGILTTRSQEIGARVEKNQTVFTVSLTRPIWVRTYVQERDLGNIKYALKAKILTDTVDNNGKRKEFYGHVGYISPIAEFSPKTVQTTDLRVDLMYRLRVYIDEENEFLRQGMPVTVRLDLNNE